jgi:hypothetical protein
MCDGGHKAAVGQSALSHSAIMGIVHLGDGPRRVRFAGEDIGSLQAGHAPPQNLHCAGRESQEPPRRRRLAVGDLEHSPEQIHVLIPV